MEDDIATAKDTLQKNIRRVPCDTWNTTYIFLLKRKFCLLSFFVFWAYPVTKIIFDSDQFRM